ncbi:MAG: cytochrome b [Gammaproteobacteria bacterium]|jgi:cytochrome b561|nr:cytochrome b [Gammaproteobacteria bacterium]
MKITDNSHQFGLVSILLHWILAVLIIGLFVIGNILEDMPRGPDKGQLMGLHQSIGMLVLALVLLRLIWRLRQGFPSPVNPDAKRLNHIAKLWHWALLVIILAIPVTGYLSADAGPRAVAFFSWFNWPDLIEPARDLRKQFGGLHGALNKIMIPLVLIHILAAFKHHFWDRDTTLKRMLGKS